MYCASLHFTSDTLSQCTGRSLCLSFSLSLCLSVSVFVSLSVCLLLCVCVSVFTSFVMLKQLSGLVLFLATMRHQNNLKQSSLGKCVDLLSVSVYVCLYVCVCVCLCVCVQTHKEYTWLPPKLCVGGVSLPATGAVESCSPCNRGMQRGVNGACEFCAARQFSDGAGTSKCTMCPVMSEPQTAIVYHVWDNLPDSANISTFCLPVRGQSSSSSSLSSIVININKCLSCDATV